jgi:ABC-type nitrate/sulfonate/bicarbonate transport system permease component
MAHMENARGRSTGESRHALLKNKPQRMWRVQDPRLLGIVILAGLIGWEFLARHGVLSPIFFPPPRRIARSMVESFANGELLANLGATLSRVLLGLGLGGIPGLMLGLGMGSSARLRSLVDPFIAAVHPIPKIAMLPLVMVVLGIGEASKIAVITMSAFFPLLINAMAGVQQISPIHFEVVENYGANRMRVLTAVIFPGSLPLVLAGCRLAFNSVLTVTIAIEVVAAQTGLGAMIWFAWQTLRIEELYAGIVITAILGNLANFLLQSLTARLVPWQVESWT